LHVGLLVVGVGPGSQDLLGHVQDLGDPVRVAVIFQ
jgi:hypothetical protein